MATGQIKVRRTLSLGRGLLWCAELPYSQLRQKKGAEAGALNRGFATGPYKVSSGKACYHVDINK